MCPDSAVRIYRDSKAAEPRRYNIEPPNNRSQSKVYGGMIQYKREAGRELRLSLESIGTD